MSLKKQVVLARKGDGEAFRELFQYFQEPDGTDTINFAALHGRLYHATWLINSGWEVLHDGKRDFHPIKQ